MEEMLIYRMRSLEASIIAIQELDRAESKDLIVGLGLIAIARSRKSEDWYVFANLQNHREADRTRIANILAQCGTASSYSFDQVFNHANRFFCASGWLEQIMTGLSLLDDDKLRPEVARLLATFGKSPGATQ